MSSLSLASYRTFLNLDSEFKPAQKNIKYREILVDIAFQLLQEHSQIDSIDELLSVPTAELALLVKQLLTVRPAQSNELLFDKVDYLLTLQSKSPIKVGSFQPINKQASQIFLYKGDITAIDADYIVNAANLRLEGCFQPNHPCIDNAIHSKGGPRIRQDLHELKSKFDLKEEPGHAIVTRGYSLPSKFILHTVGPQISSAVLEIHKAQLVSSYAECLNAVKEHSNPEQELSIAFCCISTGIFGYPNQEAAEIAIKTVLDWIEANYSVARNWKIIFNVFIDKDVDIYSRILAQRFGDKTFINSASLDRLAAAQDLVKNADIILIAAGAGLSAAAGLDYTSEEVFKKHFPVMHKLGFKKFYDFIGYKFRNPRLKWGYLLAQIKLARFNWKQTTPVYDHLARIISRFDKQNTFILTSNADGMFDQSNFDLSRVLTVQGDYSNLQCLNSCKQDSIWPTKMFIDQALPFLNHETQQIENDDALPKCPRCGGEMMLNVRGGDWFNEYPYRHQKAAYAEFLQKIKRESAQGKKVVILEIGVGFNTPSVIRWPMEALAELENVSLVRINKQHPEVPTGSNGVGLDADTDEILVNLALRK